MKKKKKVSWNHQEKEYREPGIHSRGFSGIRPFADRQIKLIWAYSLDRELMELFDAYQVKAKQSGIHLEFQTDDALPVIEADAHAAS